MKNVLIVVLVLMVIALTLWMIRYENSYLDLRIDSYGTILAREMTVVEVPVIGYFIKVTGLSPDGALRTYGNYKGYAIDLNVHSEIKEFINGNRKLGFHNGWGTVTDASGNPVVRIGVQCGVGSGSIARNWTIENGQSSNFDVVTK